MPEDPRPRPERRGEPDRSAIAVDHRHVRRPGGARPGGEAVYAVRATERTGERARFGGRPGKTPFLCVELREPRLNDQTAARRGGSRQHRHASERPGERRLGVDAIPLDVRRKVREQDRDALGSGVTQKPEGRHETPRVDLPRRSVDGLPAGLSLQDRHEDLVEESLCFRRRERPGRELESGQEEARPGEAAASLVSFLEPGKQARHCDGSLPHVEHLRGRVCEVDLHLVHRTARTGGDGKKAVEHRRRLARLVEHDEAASARACQRAFRHERRKDRGDGGIHARPALTERPRTGFRRVSVPRCDSAAHGGSVNSSRARRRAFEPGLTLTAGRAIGNPTAALGRVVPWVSAGSSATRARARSSSARRRRSLTSPSPRA